MADTSTTIINTPTTSTTTSTTDGPHYPGTGIGTGQLSYDKHIQWVFAGPGYRAD